MAIQVRCGECNRLFKATAHSTGDGRGFLLRCRAPRNTTCEACPLLAEPMWDGDNLNLDTELSPEDERKANRQRARQNRELVGV